MTEPVQLLLEDGCLDAGQQQLLLAELSEVEEVDVDLYAAAASPSENVLLEQVESRLFYVNHEIGGSDLAEREESCRSLAGELVESALSEEFLYGL